MGKMLPALSAESHQEDSEIAAVDHFMMSLGITPPTSAVERVPYEPTPEMAAVASYIVEQTRNTGEAIKLAETYATEHGMDAKAIKMAIWHQDAVRSSAEFIARVSESRTRTAAITARAREVDALLEGVISGACNPDDLARARREANSIEVEATTIAA
jgi:hypothetical protein